MSTRTHISLPDALHERMERARGDVPRSRFITRAVESFVESFEAPTRGNPMAKFKVTEPMTVQGDPCVGPGEAQPTAIPKIAKRHWA